jgi:hypothetical protein
LTGRVEYNDNVALRASPTPSWRFVAEPNVALVRLGETGQLTARARLAFNRYTNPEVPDATDRGLSVGGTRRFERDSLGLQVDYAELSTQSAQVLGQTGLNLGRRQVETLSIVPRWTRSLAPRWSLLVDAGHVRSHFQQDASTTPATDYVTTSGSVGLNREFGERLSGGLSVAYLGFDTDPFISRTRSISLNANASWYATPTLKLIGGAGAQRVETERQRVVLVCPVDPSLCQAGLVALVPVGSPGESTRSVAPFNAGMEWQMSETERLVVSVSRRLNPSGVGVVTGAFLASAYYSRALSPRTDFALSATLTRSGTLEGVSLGYVGSISPTLTYRWSPAWSSQIAYIHTSAGLSSAQQRVSSNAVFATLSYGWPQWTSAR